MLMIQIQNDNNLWDRIHSAIPIALYILIVSLITATIINTSSITGMGSGKKELITKTISFAHKGSAT